MNVLADVLSRPTQISGTKCSLHPYVFQPDIREWGIPLLDLFLTRWNHKLPIYIYMSSVPDPSAMAMDALSISNVGICLSTCCSVATSSREDPTRPMLADPHCPTLATCDLVSTSPRDVGGFPLTDPQHPSITVAATRTNPSRYLQSTATR